MIRHLFGYSRHGIKKRTIKILFKVRKLIINSDKSERESGSNNKISKKIPLQDNAEGIKFIKRFSRVIAYSRDELLFIIDNDKLKYITRNPLFLFKGKHSYKIRCTTYKTEFYIYTTNKNKCQT